VKAREQARLLESRARLLEIEAGLQRAALAATFAKWQERRLLAVGSTLATWGWRLVSVPRVRWLLAATVLAKLRKRRNH
jgi:hypothetical protein